MTDPPSEEIRALAEAVADVLASRGLVAPAPVSPARVLGVSDVARLLGRKPAWVYAHAAELGAFRFGDGPKARLGFDAADIARWKRARQVDRPPAAKPKQSRRRKSRTRSGTKLIPYEQPG